MIEVVLKLLNYLLLLLRIVRVSTCPHTFDGGGLCGSFLSHFYRGCLVSNLDAVPLEVVRIDLDSVSHCWVATRNFLELFPPVNVALQKQLAFLNERLAVLFRCDFRFLRCLQGLFRFVLDLLVGQLLLVAKVLAQFLKRISVFTNFAVKLIQRNMHQLACDTGADYLVGRNRSFFDLALQLLPSLCSRGTRGVLGTTRGVATAGGQVKLVRSLPAFVFLEKNTFLTEELSLAKHENLEHFLVPALLLQSQMIGTLLDLVVEETSDKARAVSPREKIFAGLILLALVFLIFAFEVSVAGEFAAAHNVNTFVAVALRN